MSAPFEDFGFADREGAMIVARRRKLAREHTARQFAGALDDETSSPAPLGIFAALQPGHDHAKADDLLNQRIEKVCRDWLGASHVLDADKRYLQGVIAECAIKRIRRADVSKQQLLQGLESILEFVELVLSDFGHDGVSAVRADGDGTGETQAPHRFDGGAK